MCTPNTSTLSPAQSIANTHLINVRFVMNIYLITLFRCLENVINENQSLNCYRETIESMIRECEETSSNSSGYSATDYVKLTHNVNQGVEEMKMKVSKIFSKTGTKPSSIQNMFKKK